MGTRGLKRAEASSFSPPPPKRPRGAASEQPMENERSTASSRGRGRGRPRGSTNRGSGRDKSKEKDSERDVEELEGRIRRFGVGEDGEKEVHYHSFSQQDPMFLNIFEGLRAHGQEGRQLMALTQLCDVLSMGTEDTLPIFAGGSFVPVLVGLLTSEGNDDIMLLAARAITHLCDVFPSSCSAMVQYGAIPHFCARLLTIEFMDLAEQSLQALSKISRQHPTACLRGGALMAVLLYLDFFSAGVQRIALSTAANICQKLPTDAADFVMDAVPTLINLLQHHDAKVVEYASICLTRIAEAFVSSSEKLDSLCKHGLVAQAASLISVSSSGGAPVPLSTSTYTGLIRLLSLCVKGSALGAETLFSLGISGILKEILSGSGEIDGVAGFPALTRSSDQILELVSLADELLPSWPQRVNSLQGSSHPLVKGFSAMKKSLPTIPVKIEDSSQQKTRVSAPKHFLNVQPELFQQFGVDLLPVLVQVFESSANGPTRCKCLSVIGKLMFFSRPDMIEPFLCCKNVASFLAGVLASKEPQLVMLSLLISKILMEKLPQIFPKMFVREGAMHALDVLISADSSPVSKAIFLNKGEDSLQEVSRTRRGRPRLGSQSAGVGSHEDSRAPAPESTASPPCIQASSVNSSLRTTNVSALAKSFKDKFFPADDEAASLFATDDLLHLKSLCTKLNVGMNNLAGTDEGKFKASATCSREILSPNDEQLRGIISEMLLILSHDDKVSNFEFIGSGVILALLNYISCGTYMKGKVSETDMTKFQRQVIKRLVTFVSVAFPSGMHEANTRSTFSGLLQKLQNALSSLERFPVVLSHPSQSPNGTAILSPGFRVPNQYVKLRLCRAHAEKALRDISSEVLLFDPSASLADIEDFLWPRVIYGESGEKPLSTSGSSAQVPLGAAAVCSPIGAHASSGRRPSTRSRPSISVNVCNSVGDSLKGKAKALLMPLPDDVKGLPDDLKGPPRRSYARRKAVLEKGVQMKSAQTTSEGTMSFVSSGSSGGILGRGRGRVNMGRPGLYTDSSNDAPRLLFFVDGKPLSSNSTIYQAIQSQLALDDNDNEGRQPMSDVYTIIYQKAESFPTAGSNNELFWKQTSLLDGILFSNLSFDIEKSNPTHSILALLRVLNGLNQLSPRLRVMAASCDFVEGRDSKFDELRTSGAAVPCEDFINGKLTQKLARQIQGALTLCSESLPSWCYQLTKLYPFLFSFDSRRQFFYSTAFGLPRALHRLQQQGLENQGSAGERERYGRLVKQKVIVSRSKILESAAKVMEMYSNQNSLLEVEYFGEVGTGLGPTLEFYTLLSHDLQKVNLGMWRSSDALNSSSMEDNSDEQNERSLAPNAERVELVKSGAVVGADYVFAPLGLFPRPWPPSLSYLEDSQYCKAVDYFRLLGQVMAKALQDGRLMDLPLSPAFYKLNLGQELNLHDILAFDSELGKTLEELAILVWRKKYLESDGTSNLIADLRFRGISIENLCLDFTLPGYPDYILKLGGDNTMVDINNLEEYIALVVDVTTNTGIMRQMEAFRAGFNQVFDITSLRIFSPNELEFLLCGRRELWKAETLVDHIKFDHGYTAKSPAIINLLEIMVEFTPEQQRAFCQFVTGAPQLPPGGLAVLNPKLTIVRKHASPVASTILNNGVLLEPKDDDLLPSVMTCANYLKLPSYSTKEIMCKKLLYAIYEGQGSFDLS